MGFYVKSLLHPTHRHMCHELACRVLRGPTGTAKTQLLQRMSKSGFQVLDLEALANHKGSVLGKMPDGGQPSQKLFESRVYSELQRFDPASPVWLEGEGSKIGSVYVPIELVDQLRNSATILIGAPKAARINYILEDYKYVMHDTERLKATLNRLAPYVGNDLVRSLFALVDAKKWDAIVEILLDKHYDILSRKFLNSTRLNIEAEVFSESLDLEGVAKIVDKLREFNSIAQPQ